MGLMDDDTAADIAATRAAQRADRPVNIVIRRGGAALAPQTVRIVGVQSQAGRDRSEGGASSRDRAMVLGAPALDIQPEDRFTVAGVLHVVVGVPDRRDGATAVEVERSA